MTTEPKGRELDVWLFERAFAGTTEIEEIGGRQWYWVSDRGYEDACGAVEVPEFSTDLTAAMQLAEQLTDRFHWRIHSPFQQGDKWFAGLTPLGVTGWNGRPDYEAGANTLPEALARVAYRALRGEEDV